MKPNAPLVRRLASLGYESLLVAAVILVCGFALAPLVTPAPAGGPQLQLPGFAQRVVLSCAMLGVAAVYFVVSWSGGRRTLAMKTWRLRIVTVDGGPVDRKRALARYLATWIGPAVALAAYGALHRLGLGAHAAWLVTLNFLWALVDRDRQFLHDRVAGTRITTDK